MPARPSGILSRFGVSGLDIHIPGQCIRAQRGFQTFFPVVPVWRNRRELMGVSQYRFIPQFHDEEA
jgi:hypothetical protein